MINVKGVKGDIVSLCEGRADADTLEARLDVICRALDAASVGVLIADPEGGILYANPRLLDLLGVDGDLVAGQKAGELLAAGRIEGLVEVWEGLVEAGKCVDKIIVWREGGTERALEVNACPVTGDGGEAAGRVAFFVDVTGPRQVERELARYERLAMLGQLTGGVAHELRSSLGLVKGSAHFLDMALTEADPDVDRAVALLKSGVEKSTRIVDSLLKVARSRPASRREVDLNRLAQKALAVAQVPENVDVVTDLDPVLPEIVADAGQLTLVLDNLIRNGVQAMPEGGRLTVTTGIRDRKWAFVSVADTGIGISEQDQEKLFEPLYTKKSGGVGLGLALVRILVDSHGGQVDLESEVGEGSVFTVCLPVEGGGGGTRGHGDKGRGRRGDKGRGRRGDKGWGQACVSVQASWAGHVRRVIDEMFSPQGFVLLARSFSSGPG